MSPTDKISDNYRNQVEKLLETGSDPGSFYELNQSDTNELWKKLSNELDIDEVWNNILPELDKEMPVVPHRSLLPVYISAILIILLTILNVRNIYQDLTTGKPGNIIQKDQDQSGGGLEINNDKGNYNRENPARTDIFQIPVSSPDINKENDKAASGQINMNESVEIKDEPDDEELLLPDMMVYELNDSNPNITSDKVISDIAAIRPVFFPDPLENVEIYFKPDINDLTKSEFHSPDFYSSLLIKQRVTLGLITSFKNTWLLNNETIEGLKYNSSHLTKMVFFPDLGISLGYSINNLWKLQAETYLSSNTGQEYYEYYNGQYVRKRIILNYSTVILFVKRKLVRESSFQPRASINILAGGYASALHYAYQERNSALQSIGSHCRNIDVGLRLGGEYESRISERLSVAPGLFLTIGLPNIYRGDNSIADYLKRTQNASAELRLAIYYGFK